MKKYYLLAIGLLILFLLAIDRYRLKRRSNRQVSRLLEEKEWLLKEIHHRVKNNLQIAMSLLNIQSNYLGNEKAQTAIHQTRNRMYAMSLIHQRLYQTDNLETIDMQRYIPELVDYIFDSMAAERHIGVELRIQPIRLDVAQALPVGLILNEAVTNSIKHAFPNGKEGRITIVLEMEETTCRVLLVVADDGTGVPAGFDIRREASMGMQLIDTLVQQLEGEIVFSSDKGLSIAISFEREFSSRPRTKKS